MNGATLSVESVSRRVDIYGLRWTGVYGLADHYATANWPEATTTYGGGVYDGYGTEGQPMMAAPGLWTATQSLLVFMPSPTRSLKDWVKFSS